MEEEFDDIIIEIQDPLFINIEREAGNVVVGPQGEKGDDGDNIEEIIILNGGENYTLSHSTQGKKYTIIINNPNPIPTVILHPGPSPIGPIHVFAPNASRFTRIEVLYVLGQWIKTF